MSNLKNKVLISQVLFIVLVVFMLVTMFFLPIFTLEWEEETFIGKEEYYVNVSFADWFLGSSKQVHLKNAKDYENALGLSRGQIDELLGEVNIAEDIKTTMDLKSFVPFAVSFFMISVILMTVLVAVTKKQKKEGENKKKQAEEKKQQLIQLATENRLDKKTEKQFISRVFGMVPSPWLGILFFAAGIPVWWFLFSGVTLLERSSEDFGMGLSIICFYCFAFVVVFCVLQQIFVNLITKEIREKHITSKEELCGAASVATVTMSTSADAPAPAPASESIKTATVSELDRAKALMEYKNLLDAGVITQEEFDNKKKDLLGL